MQLELQTGKPYPLGATPQETGVNFAVYAKDIGAITLCLYNEGETDSFQQIELNSNVNKTGDVWHVFVQDCPADTCYAYTIRRDDQNLDCLLDPYAKNIYSNAVWKNSEQSPYQPMGKVALQDSFDWEGDQPLQIPMKDLIIYEMHVRGFTIDPSSAAESPGTYQGLIEKLPYLRDLGINAIELMPVHEFDENEVSFTNPKTKEQLCNYFGYSNTNFFSLMNRYASSSEKDHALTEFKQMVKECHKNGIEVILDVVFNHTNESGELGRTLSYKGFDADGYYMIDEEGKYRNFTGCGNTFNCNYPPTHQLIIDALRYFVVEMHVDGFRFDLASIFTRDTDGTPLGKAPVVEAIANDPILSNTKLIAEAWDAAGLYQVGSFGDSHWSEWNGSYRDIVRRFIKGNDGHKNLFSTAICGSQDLYHAKKPDCSVNFVTCHDGFTLNDLVSYNDKHNLDNGEENRDGMNENDSWNCGAEGSSQSKKIIKLRERQRKNFLLALMISQGVPMLLMGDEYGHTKNGNNNTWCQDNRLNWFLWDKLGSQQPFHRFVKELIGFRKNHPLLRRDQFLSDQDITWHGRKPDAPEWDLDNRLAAFTLNNSEAEPELYIAFNANYRSVAVTLPAAKNGTAWHWVVNTYNGSPSDFYMPTKPLEPDEDMILLRPYSAIMLSAKAAEH